MEMSMLTAHDSMKMNEKLAETAAKLTLLCESAEWVGDSCGIWPSCTTVCT